jgi:hypothetical protein
MEGVKEMKRFWAITMAILLCAANLAALSSSATASTEQGMVVYLRMDYLKELVGEERALSAEPYRFIEVQGLMRTFKARHPEIGGMTSIGMLHCGSSTPDWMLLLASDRVFAAWGESVPLDRVNKALREAHDGDPDARFATFGVIW